MNCDKSEDQVIRYLLGSLNKEEKSSLETHLTSCPKCQQILYNFKKSRGLLAKWDPFVPLSVHKQVKQKIMDNIRAQKLIEEKITQVSLVEAIESEKRKVLDGRPKTGLALLVSTIAHHKIMASAIAALIVICVVLGVNFLSKPSMPSVAWGNLVERIEMIDNYSSQMRITRTYYGRVIKLTMDLYHSSQYGDFIDRNWYELGLNIKAYSSFSDSTTTVVYPHIKKYVRIVLSEEQVTKMHDFDDPRYPVREIMSFNYKELGSKVIDGKRVEGIEISDSKFGKVNVESCVARLWVDVETNLPVLYEARATAAGGTLSIEVVQDSFKWDIGSDASIFEPNISEYDLAAEIVSQPANEETAVEALRKFSELTGGEYPYSLAWFSCKIELDMIYREKKIEEIGTQRTNFIWEGDDFEWEPYMRLHMQLRLTCQFYGNMVKDDKDITYYGKLVTHEDGDVPLMRWRISDYDYRVIFGDLRIEDVSVEELTRLEEAFSN